VELKQIKELIALMEKAGLKKIRIKDKDKYEIELEKQDEVAPHAPVAAPAVTYVHAPHPDIHSKFPGYNPAPSRGGHEETVKPEAHQEGKFITAPLVGTVYTSPSPEDAPFVKVGDRVDENTVVCIIEAMKVMNEVKAGVSGTIAEILISNALPVEFGAKLIRVV
jgi:acetyl-CoA carboxylase biotin carboxyl carrier protein